MEFSKNIIVLGLVASLAACGDDKKNNSSGGTAGADLTKALDCRELEGKGKKPASDKDGKKSDKETDDDEEAALKAEDDEDDASDDGDDDEDEDSDTKAKGKDEPEARHVPADSLRLTVKKRETTMCDVLRGKDKKLALFSFASQKCDDCLERVKALNESITSQGVDSDVLSVVILTNVTDEPTSDEWNELKEENGPDAIWGLDKTGEVWKFFAGPKGAGKGVKPWVLGMDVYATGFLDRDADHDLDYLLGQAKDLLGLDIGEAKPKPAPTSTATSTRTGTNTRTSTETATGTGTGTATSAANGTSTAAATSTLTSTATAVAVP